ncbi:MAG: lysophospholipid acyltransferase family protein [Planctomycetota bacterium]
MAEPGSLFAGRPKATSRRDTPLRRTLYTVAAPVFALFGRALFATLRVRVEGEEEALRSAAANGDPVLPCFWHDQLVAGTCYLRRLHASGLKTGWLISPSFDGEVPAKIAARWGFAVVRGSATRTGVRALRDLQKAVRRDGISAVVVPDGPTGPPRVAKAGVVMLAQLSGAPIAPLGLACSPALPLPTWDRLRVPLPFARVTVRVGALQPVDRELPPDDLERARAELDRALAALS